MINRSYPQIKLYTKKQIANLIRGKNISFGAAMKLIGDCLQNKNEYWSDNARESEPNEEKWVRSACGTPLGELQNRISQRIFAVHDRDLPPYVYGGVSEKSTKDAAIALLGKKNKRILLKIDMRRFFEHISYADVKDMLVEKCSCSKEVAQIIAEVACVEKGKKSPDNDSEKVLARGFSTSSRLAVWCNLDLFFGIFYLVSKRLKGYDPKIAIYMDDIGITASRVDPPIIASLYKEILELIEGSKLSLEINEKKTKIVDYLHREYNYTDGTIKEGVTAPFEFLGIEMGRNSLRPGIKIRSKMAKLAQKPTLTSRERRTFKGQRRYAKYIRKKD